MNEAVGVAKLSVLRTEDRPHCPVCGSHGGEVYRAMPDLMLGVPGTWRFRRCAGATCRTLWLDPRPVAADLARAYENFVTHEAGRPLARRDGFGTRVRRAFQQSALGYPAQASRLERLAAHVLPLMPLWRESALRELLYMPAQGAGRMLDIGCGNGRQLERFAQAGWRTVGIDFDAGAVATARALGLDVRHGDLTSQGFDSGEFDAIVMSHVIEHVPDPVALLCECCRVLKPGGSIVLVTPNADAFGHRLYGRHWLGLEPPRHLHVLTAGALRSMVRQAGFDVQVSRTVWVMAPGFFLATEWRRRAEREATHVGLPPAGVRLPLRVLAWAAIEMLGCELGLPWGEEIVLRARRPG